MASDVNELHEKIGSITALGANFGREFPKPLLKIWLELLTPYSASEVERGVIELIGSYEYKTLPPFAVLKRILDKSTGRISEETRLAMSAEAEWNKLIADVQSRGYYNPPTFCPTTAFVIRGMGGWSAVCNWKTDNLEWRRKEFLEAWKLAYGNEPIMELGAAGVEAIGNGPIPVANAIDTLFKAQLKALEDKGDRSEGVSA